MRSPTTNTRRTVAVLGALIAAAVIVALAVGSFLPLNSPSSSADGPAADGTPVEVTVEPGGSVTALVDDLVELEVVDRARPMRRALTDAGADRTLQPGTYTFTTGMGVETAVDVVVAGPESTDTVAVTVPAGLTVPEIVDLVAQAPTLDRDALDAALDDGPDTFDVPDWVEADQSDGQRWAEGLLWPGTYELTDDTSEHDLLQQMIDRLAGHVDEVTVAGSRWDGRELITVASLVEREVRNAEEQATVAAVIANRLEDDMRLQIDATVLYARGEHTDRVLYDDLETDSPFNTYTHEGLPPGPIANFDLPALSAAAQPAASSALFYVVSDRCDGTHTFADTFEEHQQNVAAYQAADRCS